MGPSTVNGWRALADRAVEHIEYQSQCLEQIHELLTDGVAERVKIAPVTIPVTITLTGGATSGNSDPIFFDQDEAIDLLSLAATAPATSAAVYLFYMNAVDPRFLIHMEPGGQYTNGLFPQGGDYLPPGQSLIVRVEGAIANSQHTVNLRMRRYRGLPRTVKRVVA